MTKRDEAFYRTLGFDRPSYNPTMYSVPTLSEMSLRSLTLAAIDYHYALQRVLSQLDIVQAENSELRRQLAMEADPTPTFPQAASED